MTPEEEAKFWELYQSYMMRRGELRKGQAMFNALFHVAPILADMIRGTHADPYYRDDKIGAFRDVLGI